MNVLVERYLLISGFLAFLEVKVLEKSAYLNVCSITSDNQWPREVY